MVTWFELFDILVTIFIKWDEYHIKQDFLFHNKSAITDRAAVHKYVIDRERVKVVYKTERQVRALV